MKLGSLILGCLCLFLTASVFGQTAQPDKITLSTYALKGERETNYMRDSLSLSQLQAVQVDSVNKQYLKNISLLEGQGISPGQRKQKLAEYKAKRDEDLAQVLTAEQLQRYRDLLKAQEDRMKARLQSY